MSNEGARLAADACPFCGSTEITVEWEPCPPLDKTDTNRRWFAECTQCCAQGPFCQKEPEVIPAWNASKHASVPAGPQVGGEFYNGMEWFGAWLVDHAERETITEELVQQWAVEAWREHLKRQPANEPQVDATLEGSSTPTVDALAVKWTDVKSDTWYVPRIHARRLERELAHARKSHPKQGVNQRLLRAAKRAALNLPPHCGDPNKAAFELDDAISAAASVAPGMEKELAEALRNFLAFAPKQPGMNGYQNDKAAREVLAKFDAAHSPKIDAEGLR